MNMLSFFMKKKHSPDTPPEEIQGPSSEPGPPSNVGEDFIFIEKKSVNSPAGPLPNNMYPPTHPTFVASPLYPAIPYPPQAPTSITSNIQTAVPYVQDVPFVLAPQLCINNTFDVTQTQVDGILALLTRQMSMDENEEYTFALERAIQNECY